MVEISQANLSKLRKGSWCLCWVFLQMGMYSVLDPSNQRQMTWEYFPDMFRHTKSQTKSFREHGGSKPGKPSSVIQE